MTESLQPIRETISIAKPIETVWRVLTDEANVPRWLGCMRYKREVGHIFFMQLDQVKAARDDVSGATHCEILALDAPHTFKFSWFVPDFPATFVSFALEGIDGESTRVVFTHEGWDKFPADQMKPIHEMLSGGWKSFVLPGLKRTAEA